MKSLLIKALLISSYIVCARWPALAQNLDSTDVGQIEDAHFTIEKDRSIELDRAEKVQNYLNWKPTLPAYEMPSYKVEKHAHLAKSEPVSMPQPKHEVEEVDPSFLQLAKVGYGNYQSPLLDVRLVTPGAESMMAGLNFSHLSFARGEVDGDNSSSSENDLLLYGRLIQERFSLKPFLSFGSLNHKFYGYEDLQPIDSDDLQRSNQYLGAGVELSNYSHSQFRYHLTAQWKSWSDNFDNQEDMLDLSVPISYKGKYFLETHLHISKFNSESRNAYQLRPYYNMQLGELNLNLGASLSGQNDDIDNVPAFMLMPYLSATFQLTEKISVFSSFEGGINYQSLYEISKTQPYLNPSSIPLNKQVNADIDIGAEYQLNSKWILGAETEFKSIDNMLVLVNNSQDRALLDAIYDQGTVSQIGLKLNSTYYFAENQYLKGEIKLNHYNPGELDEVYHLPGMEMTLMGNHNLLPKLSVNWRYRWLSGIKAFDITDSSTDVLKPINRLEIEGHYQISDQVGAFLSVDNLLAQSYERFKYYPQRQLMLKLGVTARF